MWIDVLIFKIKPNYYDELIDWQSDFHDLISCTDRDTFGNPDWTEASVIIFVEFVSFKLKTATF